MLKYPLIDPVIFELPINLGFTTFTLAPRWYGFVYLCGFLYCYFCMRRHWRWIGLKSIDQVDGLLGIMILSMIAGSRLTYVFFYNFEALRQNGIGELFSIWKGGLSMHGGIWGCMVGSLYASWRYKIRVLGIWDSLLLATPLAVGFGRIANFINGELWGRPSDVSWAVVFPQAGPEPRHPSQLYESFLEGFLLYAVTWWLWNQKPRRGVIAGFFAMWYAVFRSIVEQFREPDRQLGFIFWGVTMGQILSVALFIMGALTIYYSYRKPLSQDELELEYVRGNMNSWDKDAEPKEEIERRVAEQNAKKKRVGNEGETSISKKPKKKKKKGKGKRK